MGATSWLIISLVCTALAQLAFKQCFRAHSLRWLGAAVPLFLLVPYTNYNALKGLPLGTVYVATAVSQLLVVVLSLTLFGERYSRRQYIGFSLVLGGVLLYNL